MCLAQALISNSISIQSIYCSNYFWIERKNNRDDATPLVGFFRFIWQIYRSELLPKTCLKFWTYLVKILKWVIIQQTGSNLLYFQPSFSQMKEWLPRKPNEWSSQSKRGREVLFVVIHVCVFYPWIHWICTKFNMKDSSKMKNCSHSNEITGW